ncbi:hypothetical protein D3C79_962050 [compost metagenome]
MVGNRSIGSKSIMFIRNTQTNTVSASGAITLLLPWYMSRTLLSTNPTTNSTAVCSLPGTPLVAFLATLRKITRKSAPRTTEKNIESMLIDQNPVPT